MMTAEIAQWVQQAGPVVASGVSAYGVAVLTRTQDAAADATVNLGRRILQTVWQRGDEEGRGELERVVAEAAGAEDAASASDELGRFLGRALRDDPELRAQLSAMLPVPAAGTVNVTASGERAVAAQHIGTVITGDGHTS
ncbi:hypothetical protein [Streptomyces sp. HNM0574]|uniref:hypothetical protein n=1 Tax=Streptomyces sp. HNM0574 TaxID=2714954 RepID=UPI001F0ECA7E|nr:hypothetical protein [Streptomyces sp. HNM0574]